MSYFKSKIQYNFKSWVSKTLISVKIQQTTELTLEEIYDNIGEKEHILISNNII